MSVLNVAVVGCGIGAAHLEEGYLPNADRFRIVAICDINPAALTETGERFGIADRVTDFDALLARADIDVIDICTPPRLHLPQTLAALAAGKHVICEKPLCASLAEVDRVAAAAEAARGLLMPVLQYRFGDGIEQVREIIAGGLAGKPYVATAETFWTRRPEYYAVPWRGKWASELGGALISQAIHLHDIATHLMGPVERVFGRLATRVNAIEVEDCASASLLLRSGALLSLTVTLGAQEETSRIRMAFEHATFESDHDPYNPGNLPWRIIPASPAAGAPIDALLAGWRARPSRFEAQLALFHDAVRGRGPLPVSVQDARAALELATAIYHSAATGRDVPLPIAETHPFYRGWGPAPGPGEPRS